MLDKDYNLRGYPPEYFATEVITKEWVQPVDAPHRLFKASSDVTDAARTALVTAYAVETARWSVVGHAGEPRPIQPSHREIGNCRSGVQRYFSGLKWIASPSVPRSINGIKQAPEATPTPTDHRQRHGFRRRDAQYQLPKASITLLRGRIEK